MTACERYGHEYDLSNPKGRAQVHIASEPEPIVIRLCLVCGAPDLERMAYIERLKGVA
jgi:hypothetical protein